MDKSLYGQKRKHLSEEPERSGKAAKLSKVPAEPPKKYNSNLEKKLDQGRELVFNAIKLVRRFERQKLSRRSKTAEADKNEKDIKRIDDEIRALNTLDVGDVTDRHIKKVFLKIKVISTSGKLPESIAAKEYPSLDQAAANVTARLYKAPQVTDAMKRLVEAVRREVTPKSSTKATILSADDPNENSKDKQPSSVPKRSERLKDNRAEKPGMRSKSSLNEEEEEEEEVNSDVEETIHVNGQIEDQNGGHDLSDEGSIHKQAGSPQIGLESEEDGSEAEESEADLARPSLRRTNRSLSISSSDAEEFSKESTRASTFLPSLTAGGYISDSDSEASDINADIAPRKNRRGQRARQQIAERKYGASAKHIQKVREKEKRGKNAGWDARRGAVPSEGSHVHADRARMISGLEVESNFSKDRGVHSETRKPEKRKKDDEGPLHPSWVARKQAKEKEQSTLKQFAGKKVVFD